MQCVFDESGMVRRFVAELIPACRERGLPESSGAIGVLDAERNLVGGMVYHNYDPDAGVIEISGAAVPGSGWLTRETLRVLYGYPFEYLNCQMVVQRTECSNEQLLRQLAAFGYRFARVPRLFGRDRDAMICTLTIEDWRDNKFNRADRARMREAA